MRLLTHNMLTCKVKDCIATAGASTQEVSSSFPLKIVVNGEDGIHIAETLYSKEFALHIMNSLNWPALCKTVAELNCSDLPMLPEDLPSNLEAEDELLQSIHRVLFDTNIIDGELVCNNCSRSYPIEDGLLNMTLEEDEV